MFVGGMCKRIFSADFSYCVSPQLTFFEGNRKRALKTKAYLSSSISSSPSVLLTTPTSWCCPPTTTCSPSPGSPPTSSSTPSPPCSTSLTPRAGSSQWRGFSQRSGSIVFDKSEHNTFQSLLGTILHRLAIRFFVLRLKIAWLLSHRPGRCIGVLLYKTKSLRRPMMSHSTGWSEGTIRNQMIFYDTKIRFLLFIWVSLPDISSGKLLLTFSLSL